LAVVLSGCIGTQDFSTGGGGGGLSNGGGATGGNGALGGGTATGTGGGGVMGGGGFGGGGQAGGGQSGGGFAGGGGMGGFGGSSGWPPDSGTRPGVHISRSSTMAVAFNNPFIVGVNPEIPGIIVLERGSAAPTQRHDLFVAGQMPSSIALDPSETKAVVTLRKSNQAVLITGLPSAPAIDSTVQVCAEPTGVAITPDGQWAVIACFGEPMAYLWNQQTSAVSQVALPGVGRSVAISPDGSHAYLPLFYGEVVAEGSDMGRLGHITPINLATRAVEPDLLLHPIPDTGYGPLQPDGTEGTHVGCSPNQLAAATINWPYLLVPYTCVSPAPPATATSTVFSVVGAIDLTIGSEVINPMPVLGSRGAPIPANTMMAGVVDVDVGVDQPTLYVLAQGANRIATLMPTPPFMEMPALLSSDLSGCGYMPPPGCQGSTDLQGVAISVRSTPMGLFVNDWTARAFLWMDPMGMVQSFPYDPMGALPGTAQRDELEGRFLFYTAQGRWSRGEAGSCASCHPDGLSDNVTWMFGSGPRQTPPLDGTFAKTNTADHRVQNWTGNLDEIYDVENVVRNVLGGNGALVYVDGGVQPLDGGSESLISLSHGITLDGVVTRNDNLSGSTRTVDTELSSVHDWSVIETFIQSVHTNNAPTVLQAAGHNPARGRSLFGQAGCFACHAGPKWTISYVPYTPSPAKNGSLVGDNGLPASPTGLRLDLRTGGTVPSNHDTFKVAVEMVPNPAGGAPIAVGPERITCVLRDVGTYDASSPLEHKPDGTRSQGALGFNVPSLLGLATSAPYFHDGSAKTLTEALSAPRYQAHLQAGNTGYVPTSAQDVSDLADFLLSIDESTMPFVVQNGTDVCGGY
jgi:hypothetical protein